MTQREKLVELVEDSINKWDFYLYHFDDERLYDDESEEKKKSFEEFISDYLLENGVIIPPCKVGDIVWYVYMGQIHPHKIKEIQINKFGEFVVSSMTFQFKEFDKTVFLTKEEAEKALAERKANEE